MSTKVVVVDDHEVVRAGLEAIFENSDITIVAGVASGSDALKAVRKHKPDLIIMDVRMAVEDGIESLEKVKKKYPNIKVVMLSAYDNPTYIARCLALGASDYILKGNPRRDIVNAVKRVAKGNEPKEGSLIYSVKSSLGRRVAPRSEEMPLTNREYQVISHIALGLSNREIAHSLEISVETVKEHVQNILRKLRLNDRTQAAVWAVRRGIV
ncbi:MAG: response regulator transcription factor [Pirellulaceae bacterium]|nr:response regulator transcription factor [Pirellulaceae bacterium]